MADTPAAAVRVQDHVLVAVTGSLSEIAADHGATIFRSTGRSGFAVLATADGSPATGLLAALRDDGRVRSAGGHAMVVGAGKGVGKNGGGGAGDDGGGAPPPGASPRDAQWHIEETQSQGTPFGDVSRVVVAVLDTGVAYETHGDASGTYVQAPSLADNPIVAPHDFVNNDEHANDDHMHGTHIASIIASKGAVSGIAPGAALMPLKVLDETKSGYEIDLVEAIYWAIDNGADVINMSLSFGEGYVPSRALLDALDAAVGAGVVLVAATGNDALSSESWPAASPQVISVSSGCTNPNADVAAEYANRGAGVTLVSSGGCLDRDNNGDGFADGILAETIAPGDPTSIGYWFAAGTSQAAATVSGAAARMVALGMPAERIGPHLERTADGSFGGDSYKKGLGAGLLRTVSAENMTSQPVDEAHVALLPHLRDLGDGTVQPVAVLTVLDGDLSPLSAGRVNGRIEGASSANFECVLRRSDKGRCEVTGPAVAATDAEGEPAALAWSIEIGGVRVNEVNVRPDMVVFASDGLEELLAADDPALQDTMLGFYFSAGADPELGQTAEAYAVVNVGTGIATSPFGVVFTPGIVDGLATEEIVAGGSGISTSPFGYRLLTFDEVALLDGSGIATSPFGFTSLRISAFDGSGIATSPFGAVATLAGPVESCASCLYDGEPVLLGSGVVTGANGTALSEFVAAGAWSSSDGYAGASLVGSTMSVQAELIGSGAGLGLQAWR